VFSQLAADKLRVCWRDGFVQLTFRHPINPHCITGSGNAAITPAVNRNKINHVISSSILRLPFIKCVTTGVLPMRWNSNWKIRLKQAMAQNAQALKHRAAKNGGIKQWRAFNIFDHVWFTGLNKHFAHGFDQPGPFMAVAVPLGEVGIRLTGRRGMHGVKGFEKIYREREGVGVNKFKRKMRLRLNINSSNLEPRAGVPDSNAPGAAKTNQEVAVSFFKK